MDKKNAAKIAAAAVLVMMVASVIHGISSQLTSQYYTDPAYANLWSNFIVPSNFVPLSLLINFVIAALFAQAYLIIKGGIPGGNCMKKGLNYGLVLFLLTTLPMNLMLFLMLNIPLAVLIFWTLLDGFVLMLIAGIIIARIVN